MQAVEQQYTMPSRSNKPLVKILLHVQDWEGIKLWGKIGSIGPTASVLVDSHNVNHSSISQPLFKCTCACKHHIASHACIQAIHASITNPLSMHEHTLM